MNSAWLAALGLALVLVGGVVVLLLRRRRGRHAAVRPTAPAAPAATPVAVQTGDTAAEIDARRQATTEALRLARQRKAEESARQEAGRSAPARRVPAPPARPASGAPRTQAGWASRPMDLGPAEPASPRPAPAPTSATTPTPIPTPAARQAATPAPPASAQPLRHLTAVQPPAPASHTPVPATPAPRLPVVLVADDSKVVRVKTGRLLEKQGWQVLLADDGAAALALLDQHTPDLLITDVEMPGLDGFALTRQVRAQARSARLPVIMITSSDAQHRPEAEAAGVDLLLGKPYAEETLLAQAQRLLRVAPPVLH